MFIISRRKCANVKWVLLSTKMLLGYLKISNFEHLYPKVTMMPIILYKVYIRPNAVYLNTA